MRVRFALHAFYVRSAANPADVWSRQLLNTSHDFDDGLGGWHWSLRRLDNLLTDNVLDDFGLAGAAMTRQWVVCLVSFPSLRTFV